MRKFDGNGPEGKIYLACNDYVFDVTGSPYYSPGGDYEKFAGRDISMACAHHSTSDEHINMIVTPETRLTFS